MGGAAVAMPGLLLLLVWPGQYRYWVNLPRVSDRILINIPTVTAAIAVCRGNSNSGPDRRNIGTLAVSSQLIKRSILILSSVTIIGTAVGQSSVYQGRVYLVTSLCWTGVQ